MTRFGILLPLFSLLLASAGPAQAQSYSSDAIDTLRYMIEEEKLAGDVYRAFADLYPDLRPFQNIPRSEDMHFSTLVGQAGLAGVDVGDLTMLASGVFSNPDLQALYADLIAEGSASAFAALAVGRNIELLDIADLTAARALVPADSTLYAAYGNLMDASYNHLNAFTRWQAMVPAPVPEPASYAMMLAGLGLVGVMARRR